MTDKEIQESAEKYMFSNSNKTNLDAIKAYDDFIAGAKWMQEKDKTMPNGSAKIVFDEFWEQIKDSKCTRQTLASLAFDEGHSLRHKEEEQDNWISEIQKASFWSKCNYNGYCWEWTGAKNKNGYGCFRLNDKTVLSHRLSFEIINGKIENNELVVMHECDNPSCVNPSHLLVGTQQENCIDKSFKNRGRNTRKSSSFYGVGFRSDSKKWRAYVKPFGEKQKYIGSFDSEIEAANARDKYIIANRMTDRLNFPKNPPKEREDK